MKLDLDFDFDELSLKEQKEKALAYIITLLGRFQPIVPVDMSLLSYQDVWTLLNFCDEIHHRFFAYICNKKEEEK